MPFSTTYGLKESLSEILKDSQSNSFNGSPEGKDPQRQILEHLPRGIPEMPCPSVYGLKESQSKILKDLQSNSLNGFPKENP